MIFPKYIDQMRNSHWDEQRGTESLHTMLQSPKSSFGPKEMFHLEYIINREGYKPNPRKINKISDLGISIIMNESQAIIRMV